MGALEGTPQEQGTTLRVPRWGCRPELWRSLRSETSRPSRPMGHPPGCKAAGRRKALLLWLCSGAVVLRKQVWHLHCWDLTRCSRGLTCEGLRAGQTTCVSHARLLAHRVSLRHTCAVSVMGGRAVTPAHPDRLPKRPSRGIPWSQTTGRPQTNLKRKLVCYGGGKKKLETRFFCQSSKHHVWETPPCDT